MIDIIIEPREQSELTHRLALTGRRALIRLDLEEVEGVLRSWSSMYKQSSSDLGQQAKITVRLRSSEIQPYDKLFLTFGIDTDGRTTNLEFTMISGKEYFQAPVVSEFLPKHKWTQEGFYK